MSLVRQLPVTQTFGNHLRGVNGSFELAGPFDELGPLLVLGEQLHLGKGAAFGMGNFAISAVD